MGAVNLKLDWATHASALMACKRWHYSGSLPPPPMVRVGVWEDGVFVGVVLFARGATQHLLRPYGLKNIEGGELVRVALASHKTPVSRIVSIAVKMLHKAQPLLRLIVSFADPAHGHHGGIYQAAGWIYAGTTPPSSMYRDAYGKLWHGRMVSPSGTKRVFGRRRSVLTPDQCERVLRPGKHRYLMPLDAEMRARIEPLRKPYPKRAGSADSGTSPDQGEGAGAKPSPALTINRDTRD